jgi:hypothetical protein
MTSICRPRQSYGTNHFTHGTTKKRKAPKEQLIDFIIQHAKPVTRLKLMVEKDLGTRPIELFWLKVEDIDLTNGNVSITGAKHTVGREGKLKANTLSLLKLHIEQKI